MCNIGPAGLVTNPLQQEGFTLTVTGLAPFSPFSPRGWRADVRFVPSHENRSHGSTMGIKLRRFCDGTRFRYVFY